MTKIAQQCKGGTLHLVNIPPKYKVLVARTAEKSFEKAGKLFALKKSLDVAIFPNIPGMVIHQYGVGGSRTFLGHIVLSIDFSRHNVKENIKQKLPPVIYHELSHVACGDASGYPTLLERFILEGIGCYIEKTLFKEKVPYIAQISNEMKYWKWAQKKLERRMKWEESDTWFFGTTKKLPRWIGYRLGYLLVEGYMKNNPKTSFAQLVRLEAKTILQGSKL